MPEPAVLDDWARYVAGYHDAHAGITEDALGAARDAAGRSIYDWLAEAVPAGASPVVDLCCGSAPLAGLLGAERVVGVDRSAGELARACGARPAAALVRADASAVPIVAGRAGALVVSMALMLLPDLDAVLGEVGRLLRRGGVFAATLPVRGDVAAPAFVEILEALGQGAIPYPAPLDRLAERFAGAGLTQSTDETALFTRTLRRPDEADTVVRSFYAPGAGAGRVAAAVAVLERRVAAAPVDIVYPIRRLVAHR